MKTTQTFGVRFIALPKKSRPDDAFIYVRITVSKKVIDISLKKTVPCSLWDSKQEYGYPTCNAASAAAD